MNQHKAFNNFIMRRVTSLFNILVVPFILEYLFRFCTPL